MNNIIVIDDEHYICGIIKEALGDFENCQVTIFTDPEKASSYIENNSVDLVLTDLVMGSFSGESILETTLKNHPDSIVILMTGYPTIRTAISVLRKGGYDYLIKPFKLENLKATIMRGLEHQRLKRENVELRSQLELMKVKDALARGIRLQPLISLIVDSAINVLPAQGASVLLRDRKTGEYALQYQAGVLLNPRAISFLRGSYLETGIDFAERQPYLISEDVEVEGQLYKSSLVAVPMISNSEIVGILNLIHMDRFNHISPGQIRLSTLLAMLVTSAVESNQKDRDLKRSYLMTIKALANAIEARDKYTAGHTDRVYKIAIILARRLNWSSAKLANLRTGCILHDIGKIGVPDCILNKPERLNDEEMEVMKRHPQLGVRILTGIPFMDAALPFIISHHEKYDGTGYPYGLRGEEIPIEGRLLAVVDTFDAIMSDRPYRSGGSVQTAVDELIRNKGIQFDPHIVDIFLEAFNSGSITRAMNYKRKANREAILSRI